MALVLLKKIGNKEFYYNGSHYFSRTVKNQRKSKLRVEKSIAIIRLLLRRI